MLPFEVSFLGLLLNKISRVIEKIAWKLSAPSGTEPDEIPIKTTHWSWQSTGFSTRIAYEIPSVSGSGNPRTENTSLTAASTDETLDSATGCCWTTQTIVLP
jgi:hypothetical protein